MDILIGCEESQEITKAFRRQGHNAFSNDLKECSGGHPGWHLQMDVLEAIQLKKWDIIGLHPVCTKMALSGNRHYAPGKPRHHERIAAVEWTIGLWKAACANAGKVYMENPLGAMNTDLRLPIPQIIQPYFFGDEAQKTTCLWLYNLPKLVHAKVNNLFQQQTHVGKGEMVTYSSGCVMPKWYADTASRGKRAEANRAIRSKTYPGIASAMSVQWLTEISQGYAPAALSRTHQ